MALVSQLLLSPNGFCTNPQLSELPPALTPYDEAVRKAVIPKKTSTSAYIEKYLVENQPILEDAALIKLLDANKTALDFFRKATLLESNGALIVQKSRKSWVELFFDETESLQSSQKKFLCELLLLESARQISLKNYPLAEECNLSVVRFLVHTPQEKFQHAYLLSEMAPWIVKTIGNPFLGKQHVQELLSLFLTLKNNQDFLKSDFKLEAKLAKEQLRRMEEKAGNGANREAVLGEMSLEDIPFAKDMAFDKEFFVELRKKIDPVVDAFFKTAVLAAKTNQPELIEKIAEEIRVRQQKEKPWQPHELWMIFKIIQNHKSRKLIAANVFANFLIQYLPDFSVIVRNFVVSYHVFYNELNVLIAITALRLFQLENGALPSDLSELVPRYLSEIPLDTFNDFKPLKYERRSNRCVVYSIGPDKKDDHAELIFSSRHFFLKKGLKGDIAFFLEDLDQYG